MRLQRPVHQVTEINSEKLLNSESDLISRFGWHLARDECAQYLAHISQLCSIFNHIIFILGFRHLDTHKFKQKKYIVFCKIQTYIFGISNNDPFNYILMCFINIM